jgi:hypothetical protein
MIIDEVPIRIENFTGVASLAPNSIRRYLISEALRHRQSKPFRTTSATINPPWVLTPSED